MIRFRWKSPGQKLAETHRSASGQTDASRVYEKIEKAKRLKDSVSTSVVRDTKSIATRLIFDRIERLGQRYKEDFQVSARDSKLMEKEYTELVKELHRVVDGDRVSSQLTDPKLSLSLNNFPEQINRMADAVFKGEISLVDRVSKLGDKITEAKDVNDISFAGLYFLETAAKAQVFGAKEVLVDHIIGIGTDKILDINRDGRPATLSDAISLVKDKVLSQSAAAVALHNVSSLQDVTLKLI